RKQVDAARIESLLLRTPESIGSPALVWVAGAVLLFVVLERYVCRATVWQWQLADHLKTQHRVFGDLGELLGRELAWLGEDAFVDVHLADVVQQAAERQVTQIRPIKLQ